MVEWFTLVQIISIKYRIFFSKSLLLTRILLYYNMIDSPFLTHCMFSFHLQAFINANPSISHRGYFYRVKAERSESNFKKINTWFRCADNFGVSRYKQKSYNYVNFDLQQSAVKYAFSIYTVFHKRKNKVMSTQKYLKIILIVKFLCTCFGIKKQLFL